jgi:hypothetical protein
MRKVITRTILQCDWCKEEVNETEIIFEKYDLCAQCKREMVNILSLTEDEALKAEEILPTVIREALAQKEKDVSDTQEKEATDEASAVEVVAVEEPKKRGRKKKEAEPDATELEKTRMRLEEEMLAATHENLSSYLVSMALDMRKPTDASRVDKAIMSLEGQTFKGQYALNNAFNGAYNAQKDPFIGTPEQKEVLKMLLEVKGFDFSVEGHRIEAGEIKNEIYAQKVEMSDLSKWVDENITGASESLENAPF